MSAIVAPLTAAYILQTQSAQAHAQGADAPFSRAKPGKSLAQQLVSAWSRFLAWRMRRRTRLILGALDNRMLADVGLRRSAIDAVLRDLDQRKLRWPM